MFPLYKLPPLMFPQPDTPWQNAWGGSDSIWWHTSDIAVRDPEPRHCGWAGRGAWATCGDGVVSLEGICIRGRLVADGAVARFSPNTACVRSWKNSMYLLLDNMRNVDCLDVFTLNFMKVELLNLSWYIDTLPWYSNSNQMQKLCNVMGAIFPRCTLQLL